MEIHKSFFRPAAFQSEFVIEVDADWFTLTRSTLTVLFYSGSRVIKKKKEKKNICVYVGMAFYSDWTVTM